MPRMATRMKGACQPKSDWPGPRQRAPMVDETAKAAITFAHGLAPALKGNEIGDNGNDLRRQQPPKRPAVTLA